MGSFKEYVQRRDEVSFNPLHRADANNLLLHPLGAAAGLPFAANSGLSKIAPQYRAMTTGNPYKSTNPNLAIRAFEKSRDWLLNNSKGQAAEWLLEQLHTVMGYIQSQKQGTMNVAGVNMGQKPTMMGQAFALPVSVIKGMAIAAKNMFDTLNPMYVHKFGNGNQFAETVTQMLQSLDALPIDTALNKVTEFIHVLQNGGDSSHIDADARSV